MSYPTVEAFPLTWPVGRPRTPSSNRRRATFGRAVREPGRSWTSKRNLTIAEACGRLDVELDRLGAANSILSTNLQRRLDGAPRSNQPEPQDPGAAIYFVLDGQPHCLACDAWDRVADNIAALAKHIEALRGMERWGVGDLKQAFAGYVALPAAGETTRRPWREVLCVNADESDATVVRSAIKLARSRAHPDRHNGDRTQWDEVEAAVAQALVAFPGAR